MANGILVVALDRFSLKLINIDRLLLMRDSGMRGVGLGPVVGVLGDVRQGAAHAHARVPLAAEGADVRLHAAARRQGDVCRRRA